MSKKGYSEFTMKNLRTLIVENKISVGTRVVWNRRSMGIKHVATINEDGTITTDDGKRHKTPSGAAKHLNSNKPIDGWLAWKLEKDGTPLSALRG